MGGRRTSAGRLPLLLAAAFILTGLTICNASRAADPKWPTDDALRSGMAAIRKATLDNHTLITHRRMPPASARAFADRISNEVAAIKGGAVLQGQARSLLDTLLEDITTGSEAIAGKGALTPIDGLVLIDAALVRYPHHFDDPTWQPLR